MGDDGDILARLEFEGDEVLRLQAMLDAAIARRNALIMEAFKQGRPRALIARSARISEPMIYKIKTEQEKKS